MKGEIYKNERIIRIAECTLMLEVAVARYLEVIAGKLPSPYCLAVAHISRESWNHAKFLSELSGAYGVFELEVSKCKEILGEAFMKTYKRLNEATKEVEKKWSLTPEEAAKLIRKNLDVEDLAGEEYASSLAMATLKLINEEEMGRQTDFLGDVFDEISKEEEYHMKILTRVIEALEKEY